MQVLCRGLNPCAGPVTGRSGRASSSTLVGDLGHGALGWALGLAACHMARLGQMLSQAVLQSCVRSTALQCTGLSGRKGLIATKGGNQAAVQVSCQGLHWEMMV